MFEHEFHTIAALLSVAAVIAAAAVWLRQPLIIAFIAVGIVVGPVGLGSGRGARPDRSAGPDRHRGAAVRWSASSSTCTSSATSAPVALATGLGQLAFTIVFGFLLVLALGMSAVRGRLRRGGADLLQHHHHRQAAVRQARTRLAARPHRGRLPDRAGHRRRPGDDGDRAHWRDAGGAGAGRSAGRAACRWRLLLVGAVRSSSMRCVTCCRCWRGDGALAGTAAALCRRLGRGAGRARRMAGLQQGGRRLPRRASRSPPRPTAKRSASRLAGLRDFLLLFFFIDLGARLDLSHARRRAGGRRRPVAVRADRQSADRDGHHGLRWATASAPASWPG